MGLGQGEAFQTLACLFSNQAGPIGSDFLTTFLFFNLFFLINIFLIEEKIYSDQTSNFLPLNSRSMHLLISPILRFKFDLNQVRPMRTPIRNSAEKNKINK